MNKKIIITIGVSKETQQQVFKMRKDNQNNYHYAFGQGIVPASVKYFLTSAIRKKLYPVLILSESTLNKDEIIKIAEELGVEYHA